MKQLTKHHGSSSFSNSEQGETSGSSSDDEIIEHMREVHCIQTLKKSMHPSPNALPDEIIFRYACFHSFNVKKAKAAIKEATENEMQRHYLNLCMKDELVKQFESRTLFPLPGLKSKDGTCDVLYMRPSRFFPESTKTESVIENLCYVLNDMSATRQKSRNGVAFIANMIEWEMENFSIEYCSKFMQALQGHMVPTKVELFLIVNPPSWFGKIWKIMRPMLSTSFAKKVHIIKEDKLSRYLRKGYEQYLPDELSPGWRSTAELVEDYIDQKTYEDEEKERLSPM